MAAVPKRRGSSSRRNRRRAHDRLSKPSLSICPKCKQAKRPHHKCPNCGYYGPPEKQATKAKSTAPSKKKISKKELPKKNETKK